MKLLKLLVILLAFSSTVLWAASSGLPDKLVAEVKTNLAFNTPATMSYDETQPIQLIIDAERIADEVKSWLNGSDSAAQMQVSLQGYGFNITPASPDTQALLTDKPTEWRWDVTPTVKQNTTLKIYLSVNVLVKVDGVQTSRRVDNFQREIMVNKVQVKASGVNHLPLPSAAPRVTASPQPQAAPAAPATVPMPPLPAPPAAAEEEGTVMFSIEEPAAAAPEGDTLAPAEDIAPAASATAADVAEPPLSAIVAAADKAAADKSLTVPAPVAAPSSRLPDLLPDKLEAEMKANIAFNTPETMHYDETKPIQLLLDPVRTLDEVKALVEEQGQVVGAEIDITPRMQASLKGEGFKIVPISPEMQAVLTRKSTEWRWDVTPTIKENTTLSLYLSINMVMKVDGAETSRMVESFRREIKVNVTPQDRVTMLLDALGGEWKWLLGTIFLPLLIWWYKQRNDKKKEVE